MENKLISLTFIFAFFISFASGALISDQGTDIRDIATGNLTALANFTISIYDTSTGGTPIFEENFTDGIVNGSWNVMISPDLEYGRIYWKDYKINGEDLDFDGNERLEFQSSVGKINNVSFVNFSLINSCSAGSSIRVIYENGSVECETDDAGAGSYNDAWINQTIYNKTIVDNNITNTNTSMQNYLDTRVSSPDLHMHNASNISSPIWVNKTGDTMSGDLNMSFNNVTSVNCITFASGGKICSG